MRYLQRTVAVAYGDQDRTLAHLLRPQVSRQREFRLRRARRWRHLAKLWQERGDIESFVRCTAIAIRWEGPIEKVSLQQAANELLRRTQGLKRSGASSHANPQPEPIAAARYPTSILLPV